jgi:hypothetical protein
MQGLLLSDKDLSCCRQAKVNQVTEDKFMPNTLHLVAWSDAKKVALQKYASEEGLEAEFEKRKIAVGFENQLTAFPSSSTSLHVAHFC